MRLVVALTLILAASAGCKRPQPPGLDEAAIEAAAKAPDAPPVNGKVFAGHQQECNDGDAHGCFMLGTAFLSGSAETTKDQPRATRLFWKACAGDDAMSCALLGHAFRDGVGGTKPDLTVAQKWYAKACKLGHEASCPRAQSTNGY